MDDEYKKYKRKMYGVNGRLHNIKSVTSVTGIVSYYMERPRPSEPPVNPVEACSFHVYELVIGFHHDFVVCKHCKTKRWEP